MSSDNNEGPIYGPNDFEIIMNHVYQNLCTLDEGDRAVGRPAQWQDLKELTKVLNSIHLAFYAWMVRILQDLRCLPHLPKNHIRSRSVGLRM